jgi:hypothetical protein
MIDPSKSADAQGDCILFKLAAETRNQIYELVFLIEPKKDGGIKLEKPPAGSALTMTCQQIYNGSHKMYSWATRNYHSNTFTLDVLDRKQGLSVPRMGRAFFHHMKSFCVTWRADEHNNGKPLRFTSHFHNRGY